MDLETPQSYPTVPSEVLLQVLSYLDAKSVSSCLRVCKSFYQTIEENLWKMLFFRDFSLFFSQMPLSEEEFTLPTQPDQIQMIRTQPGELNNMLEEPCGKSLSDIQAQIMREASVQRRNWKGLYIFCYLKIDLNGEWIGDYGRHGFEKLRIYQKGYDVTAIKLTGDENVPAGQVTWKMTLDINQNKGKGFMQIAETGYKNPTWVTSYLNVVDRNSLQITWFVYDYLGNWYSLTFGTVRDGTNQYNAEVFERKVQKLIFDEKSI